MKVMITFNGEELEAEVIYNEDNTIKAFKTKNRTFAPSAVVYDDALKSYKV